jgi:hypothetical protein
MNALDISKTDKDYKDGGKISDEILEKFQDANDRIEVLERFNQRKPKKERKSRR